MTEKSFFDAFGVLPSSKTKTGVLKVQFKGNIPTRAHEHDAGWDLVSTKEYWINSRQLVSTGTYVNIPPGFVGLVCPRSGLAHKRGISVLNAPGIIDSGYTGEIKVNLFATEHGNKKIAHGERIAQLVIVPITNVEWEEVEEFDVTERGDSGHGSTGAV